MAPNNSDYTCGDTHKSNENAFAVASPFAASALGLADLGYHPLPAKPREKGIDLQGWPEYADRKPSEAEIARWSQRADANVCAPMGSPAGDNLILVSVDIDTDDFDAIERIKSALPPGAPERFGSKGAALLYRAPAGTTTRVFRHGGTRKVLIELLAKGRQLILPPSRHPAGTDYRWIVPLLPVSELPVLTEDHLSRLAEVAEALGVNTAVAVPEHVAAVASAVRSVSVSDGEKLSPAAEVNRQLNAAALADLDAWVPDLHLPNAERTRDGRWQATPDWRESNNGNPVERRKSNLGFSSQGIVDFGDGAKGYTPIDVVMSALRISQSEAFAWLDALVHAFPEHDDMPGAEVLSANAERRRRTAIEMEVARQGDVFTWDNRHANAALVTEWLAKQLFPRVGLSLLWGQSGSGKSFVALDLAASVLAGRDFFGKRMKATGGTLFALGEAQGTMPERLNALRTGKLGDEVLDPNTGERMNTDELPIAWMSVSNLANPTEFEVFATHVRRAAKDMPDKHGCPLRMVVVDTIVASFGFQEDPDASTVTKAMKTLERLALELGILFVAVHHAGKSKEAGEHGSYAWRGSSDTSIEVDATRDPLGRVTKRALIVRKNRHGEEGWGKGFGLSTVVLGVDEDGDDITSCVVRTGDSDDLVFSGPSLSPVGARFMSAFGRVRTDKGGSWITLSTGCSVLAVRRKDAKAQFVAEATDGKIDTKRRNADRGREAAVGASLLSEESIDGEPWLYLRSEGELANDNCPDNGLAEVETALLA